VKKKIARAPGKCILFGEHAVVYDQPAISLGIENLYSECLIEEIQEPRIRLNLENYKISLVFNDINEAVENIPEKFVQFAEGLRTFAHQFKMPVNRIKITIKSEIWPGSGLGSSASTAVAFISALFAFYDLDLDKQKINKMALTMEKRVHGNPSGIDNTTCVYGKLIFFSRGNFEFLNFPENFNLLITYTGIPHNTQMAVEQVKKKKDEDRTDVEKIFLSIGDITSQGLDTLKIENYEELGILMNKNHKLLAELGLSNNVIEKINDIAILNGVHGSKLSGAGLGGCVISLGPKSKLKTLSSILSRQGYQNIITSINKSGVKIGKE
jgi:mevalonate kinase